jgi:hypothetical protein
MEKWIGEQKVVLEEERLQGFFLRAWSNAMARRQLAANLCQAAIHCATRAVCFVLVRYIKFIVYTALNGLRGQRIAVKTGALRMVGSRLD